MTELSLRIQMPGSPDRLVSVEKSPFVLGRSSECDLPLTSYGISRQHARLTQVGENWVIEDLGSKNGTRINQQAIPNAQVLVHGDRIQLENISLVVHLARPTAAAAASPPLHETPTALRLPPNPALDPTLTAGNTAISALSGGKMRITRNANALQQLWLGNDAPDTAFDRERTVARLRDLIEIAKDLTSAESSEAIFRQVQKVVFRYLTNIQRLALLVDVNSDGRLHLLDAAGRDRQQTKALVQDISWISQSVCNKVFKEGLALQTADAQQDDRFGEEASLLYKGIRSVMAVPLRNDDKVVGVLYADAQLSSSAWIQEGEEDLSFFSALANLIAASVQRWLLTRKLQDEERLCQKLGRYHSPAVVQQMIAAGDLDDGRIPPKEAEISILFADIVGFTALSERLSPAEVADLLSRFFEEMLYEIFILGGTLDKFIGDCIMAFFGAPEPQADHADRAVAAAQQMLERLADLNQREALGEPLDLRIAVNSGRAFVGDVGSSQRMDYTVLGGTVNLAARMESVCPPGGCIISQATYDLLSNRSPWANFGEHRFKGIDRPIAIYQAKPAPRP